MLFLLRKLYNRPNTRSDKNISSGCNNSFDIDTITLVLPFAVDIHFYEKIDHIDRVIILNLKKTELVN